MSFTQFIKPYPNGYIDGEVGDTPVTAEILNTNYDGFLLGLNEFLPELAGMVEANPFESATAGNLTKLKVGNSIYLIPSGGSGGSTVEWEQIQLTGTKIATITIDNVPVDVYAPSGGGSGDEVSWAQVLGSGTKIGTITINDTPIDVYAPTPTVITPNPSSEATSWLGKITIDQTTYMVIHNVSDQRDVSLTNLQNGQILKWNSTTEKWENGDESGGSSSTEYSTSEQLIGKWTDGSDLFRRTFTINNWASNDWNPINDPSINVLGFVNEVSYFDGTSSAGYHRFSLNSSYGGTTVQFIVHDTAYNYNTTHGNVHVVVSGSNMSYRASVTIIYTKA